jgi:hypothetical protein
MLVEHAAATSCCPNRAPESWCRRSDRSDGPWLSLVTPTWTAACDATLATRGRWWLFAVSPSRLNPSTEQFRSPTGRRVRGGAPRNPVVVDPRSARPAGPPFRVEGHSTGPPGLLDGLRDRVTQAIVVLSTEEYEEEVAAVVRPDPAGPFPHGLHTLTGVGQVTLVDGKRYVWSTAALVRALRGRLPG